MSTLRVYDPAQCCATGACSPDADDELAQFAASLEWLQEHGVEVARYNLGHQPGEFVQNTVVKAALDTDGVDCLPLIMADEEVVSKGAYLSRDKLGAQFGLALDVAPAKAEKASGCCG
ncbi:MAG: arsenite efflux transporter metallochaperone ArsD [Gammaproteobacteria bacterium]